MLLFRVEDHLLAYHLGRPLNTFLEWENLNIWVGRPGSHVVLMPAECAASGVNTLLPGHSPKSLDTPTAVTAAGRTTSY